MDSNDNAIAPFKEYTRPSFHEVFFFVSSTVLFIPHYYPCQKADVVPSFADDIVTLKVKENQEELNTILAEK